VINLKIEYKDPIPDKMRSLYEQAFKVAFNGCEIIWENNKLVILTNIKNSKLEIEEE